MKLHTRFAVWFYTVATCPSRKQLEWNDHIIDGKCDLPRGHKGYHRNGLDYWEDDDAEA